MSDNGLAPLSIQEHEKYEISKLSKQVAGHF